MTPEESINTQNLLGSDIAMIFDYLMIMTDQMMIK